MTLPVKTLLDHSILQSVAESYLNLANDDGKYELNEVLAAGVYSFPRSRVGTQTAHCGDKGWYGFPRGTVGTRKPQHFAVNHLLATVLPPLHL